MLLTALWLVFCACANPPDDESDDAQAAPSPDDDDSSDEEASSWTIVLPDDASPTLQWAAQDAADLLHQAFNQPVLIKNRTRAEAINIVVGLPEIIQQTFTPSEQLLPPEAFRLRMIQMENENLIVVLGADDRGAQYGLYRLLEILGFRFFHPEQTFIPEKDEIFPPVELDLLEEPSYRRRGFHIHTMHPLPHTEFLMRDSPEHLTWAQHYIDWLVRNQQNYFQWELLRTVDFDATLDHFRAIVDYAHQRRVEVGIVVTWVFAQQKAWRLVPDMHAEGQAELEANLDRLMQVPWDHINLEMGSSEFTSVDDRIQVKWMDDTAAFLADNYPETEASVKVHCSSGQTAEHYGGINFNYLPQFADPRLGVYPHTVQFYDLQGPAPVYGNSDFSALYQWMLERIGERKVYYYPETAYWCSWDIDVPLFLPIYLYSRWKDIVLLADKGLDGHVNFTSGDEWGYWFSDWSVARFTWNAAQDWTAAPADYTAIFGPAAGPVLRQALQDLILHQEDLLIGFNLAPYIAGEDTWDELGYLVGETTHPKPTTFSELYRLTAPGIVDLQGSAILGLEEMAESYRYLWERVVSVQADVPSVAAPWYEELRDCFHVNYLRTLHAYHLYAGAAFRRLHELDELSDGEQLAQAHFTQAQAVTQNFYALMRKREAEYRYPVFLSSGWGRSLTSYDYRYLWQASTGYWYKRYEKQAIEKNFNPFLDNVIDPIWFFF